VLAARIALSLFYGVAGALHLLAPEPFVRIVPAIIPWPEAVVLLTGLFEIAAALGLQVAALRRASGAGLALYAIAVWPANWVHALGGVEIAGFPTSWWYHGPRLALQPVLAWWALRVSGCLAGRRSE
jgi:uncharacterized membrane protein